MTSSSAGWATTCVIALHLAFALACGSSPRAAGESCSEDGECVGGHVCQNARCTRAQATPPPAAAEHTSVQMPPVQPVTPQPAPTADPAPSGAGDPGSAPPLAEGPHRCSFTESGSEYNRQCTVVRLSDDALRVTAPGTRLNPGQGFHFTALGSPPGYQIINGTLSAFEACEGPFGGVTTLEQSSRGPFYQIRWTPSCAIKIYL